MMDTANALAAARRDADEAAATIASIDRDRTTALQVTARNATQKNKERLLALDKQRDDAKLHKELCDTLVEQRQAEHDAATRKVDEAELARFEKAADYDTALSSCWEEIGAPLHATVLPEFGRCLERALAIAKEQRANADSARAIAKRLGVEAKVTDLALDRVRFIVATALAKTKEAIALHKLITPIDVKAADPSALQMAREFLKKKEISP